MTFEVQPEDEAQTAALCSEFNGWDPAAHPMKRRQDGGIALTLSLPGEQQYRFRYLLDGERWANDSAADASIAVRANWRPLILPSTFCHKVVSAASADLPIPRPYPISPQGVKKHRRRVLRMAMGSSVDSPEGIGLAAH